MKKLVVAGLVLCALLMGGASSCEAGGSRGESGKVIRTGSNNGGKYMDLEPDGPAGWYRTTGKNGCAAGDRYTTRRGANGHTVVSCS